MCGPEGACTETCCPQCGGAVVPHSSVIWVVHEVAIVMGKAAGHKGRGDEEHRQGW